MSDQQLSKPAKSESLRGKQLISDIKLLRGYIAAWRKKARSEFRNLAIYAALVGVLMLAEWLLSETLTSLSLIAGFAAVVFLIAAIMPLVGWRLHGGLVDTLYYTAAIGATLIIFIANGNERLVNKIGLQMEEKEHSLAQARDLLLQMEKDQGLREDQLQKMRAKAIGVKAAMDAPWVKELLSVEGELATDMIKVLGLEGRLNASLPKRLSRCDTSRRNLSLLNAEALQLEMERNFSIEPRMGAAARGRKLYDRAALLQGKIQRAVKDVAFCSLSLRSDKELLAAPDSYERLLGLAAAASDLVDTPWVRTDEDSQTVARLTQIEALEEVLNEHDRLIRSVNRLGIVVTNGQEAFSVSKDDINTLVLELEKLAKNLIAAKTGRLVGMIAHAKDWGYRVWPYLIIILLGMKLARKPMLTLK